MAAFKAVEPLKGAVEKAADGNTWVVTERGIGAVAAAAQCGYSRNGIAALLGITRDALSRAIDRQPELAAAVTQAEAALEAELVSTLVQQARGGYAPAAMFLLKTKFSYRETGNADGAAPSINIPPPMSDAELAEFLERQRDRAAITVDGNDSTTPKTVR